MKIKILPALLLFLMPALVCFAQDDPNRFLGVERWTGTISVETTETTRGDLGACITDGEGNKIGNDRFVEKTKTLARANVDLPILEKPEEEDSEEEFEPFAGNPMMKRMFEQFGGEEEPAGSAYLLWGDSQAGSGGPRGVVPPAEGPRLGNGSFSWTYNRVERGCPDRNLKASAKGSENTSDLGADVSMLLLPGRKTYSVALGARNVAGNYKHVRRERWEDTDHQGRPRYKWVTFVETVDEQGLHTYKGPKPGDFYAVQSVPFVRLAGGFASHGMGTWNLDNIEGQLKEMLAQTQTEEDSDRLAEKIDQKIPESGMVLAGEAVWEWEQKDESEEDDRSIVTEYRSVVRWNLSPHGESKYEAEAEIQGYEDWLPKGDRDPSKPGNTLKVKVRLLDKKTGEPAKDAIVKKYTFHLGNTSREPGVAMNWPVKNAAADFDMKFEESKNAAETFILKDDGQTLETKEGKDLGPQISAVVSSFDWGAYSYLTISVELGDSTVTAHLKGDKEKRLIPLPKREDGSYIADAWKKQTRSAAGKEDTADDEDRPENKMAECAAHKGDGFTLYDEYRGFYSRRDTFAENGHIRGDPRLKDVFVIDNIGTAMPGIFHYESITGLEVHPWITLDETKFDDGYIMNFNKGSVPNPVEQYAIEAARGYSRDSWAVSYKDFNRPGTPGTLPRVLVSPYLSEGGALRTIPHELLHASNVWHHGDTDLQRVWWHGVRYEGKEVIIEKPEKHARSGQIVEVYNESDGQPVSPLKFKDITQMYIANRHGQHSGFENCVMRYTAASAYDPEETPSQKRMLPDTAAEHGGKSLCESPAGTGMALTRYGDADRKNLRGACRNQICVNDKYMYAHKPRVSEE